MIPVPGHRVTTPYGKRGPHWRACGWHTGVDYAAPKGTPVVAARPGTVRHTRYGSAFGPYQFAVVASDGSEDFYAHTLDRPPHGRKVNAGQQLARVGSLGQSTGPHLHFERHKRAGRWSCSNMENPARSIEWSPPMAVEYHYGGKPSTPQTVARKYVRLDRSKWDPATRGLEHAQVYLNVTRPRFRAGATMGALRIRAVRDDGGKTSYHDYPVAELFSTGGSQLITHTYFEAGDGGATHYEVKCIGGLESVTLTTRYRKGAVVR